MSKIKIDRAALQDIADASREKTGRNVGLHPVDMAGEISMIPSGLGDERNNRWVEGTLKTVSFPDGLTEIPRFMFKNFTELTITSLPESVTSIGMSAFYGCTSLALTKLPAGITEISQGTFTGCKKLKLISLPNGVTKIDGTWNYGAFESSGVSIKSFPNQLETIGRYAFAYCNGLTDIYFMGNLKTLDFLAFAGCNNLQRVTFANTLNIATTAFSGCAGLIEINVPWSEGEVANAPWGAANATINYNYKEEPENGNQDTVSV